MSEKSVNNKGIKLIKKANNLIEARYKFDIWETRVFSTVLAQIGRYDEDFRVYRIYLRDIIKDFSINNGNAYELLREAANNLMNKKFFLDYEGDGAERKKVYHIIRSVDYMTKLIDENKRGLNEYIDISIDPDMKPLLLQLKEQFTTYDIRNIIKFKSSYTVRIYELLKQYETIGHRRIEVENLKQAFELNEEYPLFANFYQKVIEPAHRDINEYTDLMITNIDKIKNGKKVVALHFEFHKKPLHDFKKVKKSGKTLELADSTEEVSTTIDGLFLKYQSRVVGEFGLSPTAFMSALQDKTAAQIEKAIAVTTDAQKKKKLENAAGFFIEALRQGFTNEKIEKKAKAIKDAKIDAERKDALEALKAELQFKINEKIREMTTHDTYITIEAIEKVKKSKHGQFRLKSLGISNPNLDTFRNDEILREFVKTAIIEAHYDVFKEIYNYYKKEEHEIVSFF